MDMIINRLKSGLKNKKFWLKQKFFDQYSFIHIGKCGGTSIEHFLNIPKTHDSAAQRISKIGIKRWEENFTFALVRNPYSRVVSYYKWYFRKYSSIYEEYPSLNDWIKVAFEDEYIHYFRNYPLNKAPCFDWVTIDNEIVVKKITKLEELDMEWEQLCNDLSVKPDHLPVKNKTSRHSSQDALKLLDAESKQIINNYFKKDFDTFGYEMHN